MEPYEGHRYFPFANRSVRQSKRDGHEVHINSDGGWIYNLENGKLIHLFEFQGAYYLKMKITKPCALKDKDDQPLFSGRGAKARTRSIFVP